MRISGFQSISLSDFPGRTAAIVFTQGCNFRCPFCHNGSLLSKQAAEETRWDTEAVLAMLDERKKLLDGVVITGGEPTLQPDLADFIQLLKAQGYQIKLDTNGSRPEVIASLINQNWLDYIAMDIKTSLARYDRLAGVPVNVDAIAESIDLILNSGLEMQFRTTYVPALMTEHDLADIQSMLPDQSIYRVQPFIPENALNPALRQPAATIPASQW